jgi:hypothetical protein
VFLLHRSIAVRNNTFGSAMLAATRQLQSRKELRDMSPPRIMAAYRGRGMAYLVQRSEGITGHGDETFHEWVRNGGQIR